MTGTKEFTELLRAVSAVLVEAIEDIRSGGKMSMWEGIKALHLIPTILTGIKGVSLIPDEVKDMEGEEWDALVHEITKTLLQVGVTHRTSDMAERILRLAHLIVREIADILNLPPSATAVE